MPNKRELADNIPYRTLIDLHRIYLNKKHKVLSATMSKDETKYVWFELDDKMRIFLNEVLSDTDVSGIRMYFLQYPQTQQEMDKEIVPKMQIDVDQLTIGMVTTKEEAGRHIDYPTSVNKEELLVVPPFNHGQLCPQICND